MKQFLYKLNKNATMWFSWQDRTLQLTFNKNKKTKVLFFNESMFVAQLAQLKFELKTDL